MKRIACLSLACLVLSVLVGCPKPPGTLVPPTPPDYDSILGPNEMGLMKVDPKDIPDFTTACGDVKDLRQAVQNSIEYMGKPSSKVAYMRYGPTFSHERSLASLQAFAAMLDSNPSPGQMNQSIREKFDVYTSVGWNRRGEVLFTGYYTPIFNASPTQTDKFKYPIYRQPTDLQKDAEGNPLTPWPSRQELETTQKSRLAGLEMFWLADPFEVYIVHVQGSARLRMPDGKEIGVGYAANNGAQYVSIGKIMIADGKIEKGRLSLRAMMDYFRSHPGDISTYTWKNPRFVFFTMTDGNPRGSLNEPVTAWRSVATDKSIFPRASVVFMSACMPRRGGNIITMMPYTGFATDQDTGGAIRAPGRCDVYMGIGDDAGELAGRTQEVGRLYYLLLKPECVPGATTPPVGPAPVVPPVNPAPKAPAK
jgi:membrane-bound lytic murein transglycosylase A